MRLRLAGLCLALGSCQCLDARAQFGTSLFLTVHVNGTGVDQLQVTIAGDPRTVKQPESASGALAQTQTMRLLLDEAQAGKVVTVHVSGLLGGNEVATGDGAAQAVLNYETDVTVTLQAVVVAKCDSSCPGCCEGDVCMPGTDAGACGVQGEQCKTCDPDDSCEGGRCAACNETNCSDGCCNGSRCVRPPTFTQCATDAGVCGACSGVRTNVCDQGECRCGALPACAAGQHCIDGGTCVCDGVSCSDGCCDANNTCHRPPSVDGCGTGGRRCAGCAAGLTNTCSPTGNCACGGGPPCQPGQFCSGGQCICDSTHCNGCCDGDLCRQLDAGPAFSACDDSAALACAACDPSRSNQCGPFGCSCAGNAECAPGLRCSGGQCVCDSLACANGCCPSDGGSCVTAQTSAQCGVGGTTCQSCGGSTACIGGSCESCSCASGCCQGASCKVPAFTTCGGDGGACVACSPTNADRCVGGKCSCGPNGVACGAGSVCPADGGGTCECNATSCPGGCCNQGRCVSDGGSLCGLGGQGCIACGQPLADGCGGGVCRCGSGAACGFGQHCKDLGSTTACACDSTSCAGCCAQNTCVGIDAGAASFAGCGANGLACVSCDPRFADNCAQGLCRCGTHSKCGTGEQCIGGQCRCDTTTQCNGCCKNGSLCVAGASDQACGNSGVACSDCSEQSQSCNGMRECQCGSISLLCTAGQRCSILIGGLGVCL